MTAVPIFTDPWSERIESARDIFIITDQDCRYSMAMQIVPITFCICEDNSRMIRPSMSILY